MLLNTKREVDNDIATIKPPEKPDLGLRMFHHFMLHNSYHEPYKVTAGLDIRLICQQKCFFFFKGILAIYFNLVLLVNSNFLCFTAKLLRRMAEIHQSPVQDADQSYIVIPQEERR